MRLLRTLWRATSFLALLAFWVACGPSAPEAKSAVSDATTCHIHLTNAIHGQPDCLARVVAADYVATHDPACIAAEVKPGTWTCDHVDP